MATLTTLIARHPILRTLSSFLSTLDLFYLALTNRTHHSYILASRATFDALRRDCLCDGGGLAQRQNFAGLYSLKYRSYVWGKGRKIWQDEPIEVRLYATKCDEAGALPCQKCGINICEVCLKGPTSYTLTEADPLWKVALSFAHATLTRGRNVGTTRASHQKEDIQYAARISTVPGKMKMSCASAPSVTPRLSPRKSRADS